MWCQMRGGADGIEEGARGSGAGLRRHQGDDRLRPLVLDGVQHGVRDVSERLIPGYRHELPFAAFADPLQGLSDALRRVVDVAPAGAFLAAHRVHVRDAGLDDAQRPRLFLADDLAVADVYAERATAGGAVHRVAGPRDTVPLALSPNA